MSYGKDRAVQCDLGNRNGKESREGNGDAVRVEGKRDRMNAN